MTLPLPEPLIPAEIVHRDYPDMPLDVAAVRDSAFALRATAEGFRAGVLLWCAAWHQTPAGSLPNDDTELASLAGFGRVISAWMAVKSEALRNFIACSDGRLYHSTICKKALESWDRKLVFAYDKACDRLRKANKVRADRGEQPLTRLSLEDWKAQRIALNLPPEKAEAFRGTPPPIPVETGMNRIERNRTPLNSLTPSAVPAPSPSAQVLVDDAGASPPVQVGIPTIPPAPPPPKPKRVTRKREGLPCPHAAILQAWQQMLPNMPQHQPHLWDGQRRAHLQARWEETERAKRAEGKPWLSQADGITYFRKLFRWLGSSRFLMGQAPPGPGRELPFELTLEWLVTKSNWQKVLEGTYHRDAQPRAAQPNTERTAA